MGRGSACTRPGLVRREGRWCDNRFEGNRGEVAPGCSRKSGAGGHAVHMPQREKNPGSHLTPRPTYPTNLRTGAVEPVPRVALVATAEGAGVAGRHMIRSFS